MIVVANEYSLLRMNGKFTKEQKQLKRSNVKMDEDWAERISNNWRTSGVLYEIDLEATEQWSKNNELQLQLKKQKALDRKLIENSAMLDLVNSTDKMLKDVQIPSPTQEVTKNPVGRPKKKVEEIEKGIQVDLNIKGENND